MERVPRLTEKAKNTVAPLGEHVPGLPGAGSQRPLAGGHVQQHARRPGNRQLATWLATHWVAGGLHKRPAGRA